MTSDDAFLAAIDARPGDRTARLVYADWLDDHDRPDRAELIRVEEEMDRLPAFADRFWALKPRRNELRAAAPADWLGRLGYGTVCRPVFVYGWPDGWRDRWRLIREFTERWHGIPMPDVGGRRGLATKVSRRLGRELPPSLREHVAFGYDARRPGRGVPLFPHPAYLRIAATHPAELLMLDGDWDYVPAVRTDDLGHTDPPVYVHLSEVEPDAAPAAVANPPFATLTGYALGYVVDRTTGMDDRDRFSAPTAVLDRAVRELAAVATHTTLGNDHLFEADDLLAVVRLMAASWARGEAQVDVVCWRPIPVEQLPTAVVDLARSAWWATGVFAPLAPPMDDIPF